MLVLWIVTHHISFLLLSHVSTVDGKQCVDDTSCNESRYNCKLICDGDYVEMRGQEVADMCWYVIVR